MGGICLLRRVHFILLGLLSPPLLGDRGIAQKKVLKLVFKSLLPGLKHAKLLEPGQFMLVNLRALLRLLILLRHLVELAEEVSGARLLFRHLLLN